MYVLYLKKDENGDRKKLAHAEDNLSIAKALKMYTWLYAKRKSSFEIVEENIEKNN